jgi:TP901 family phage tail tape measure protein
MSDVSLSVELKTEMSALSVGLKKSKGELKSFVDTSLPGLKELQKTLNNLGVNTSNQGINALKTSMTAMSVENERLRNSILQNRVAQTQANATNAEAIAETRRQTAALVQQRIATESNRTTNAAATAQLNQLRLANALNRSSTIASSGSYNEANNRLKQLGITIKNAANGFNSTDPAIQIMIRDYRLLNSQLQNFDSEMGNNQRRVGSYITALNGFRQQLTGMATSFVSLYTLMAAVKSVIATNAEISDSFSDVRRTAGLTAVEVSDLAEQLKKLDTRTSLKGLLDIAVVGGQLGIAKDQLSGFTKAVDQLAVSLSGELEGGAEGVAKSLGVLANIFGTTKSQGGDVEKSFNMIGSAILGLGQSGLATGDYLTDFAERVGGVAAQAKLSLPLILSYGAVLQENGVSAEVAGTSFKKLIGAIATKREKFLAVAQIADANLTLKEFTNIINTDAQKALQLFFNGLQKGGGTTTQFLDLLKTVGLDASRSGQAITALALHQADLNKHVKESTVDYNNATLSAEQFAIKNDNLAGSLDKLGNSISNITTNPNSSIGTYFKYAVDSITDGIKALDKFEIVFRRIQDLNDKRLIDDNANNVIPLTDPAEIAELAAARARRKAIGTAALKDELTGKGVSNAQRIIADIKSETEFTRILRNEKKRLADINERFNYNQAYIRDVKNTGPALDAQIAKTNKLRAEQFQQNQTVLALSASYNKLYAKPAPIKQGVNLPVPEDKKTAKAFDSITKQLQDFQNKANIITKEGLSKDLQEWDDKYNKIKAVIAKLPSGDKKTTATATLETNYKEGKGNILDVNTKKVQDSIKKSQDALALLQLGGDAKEIQTVRNKYTELYKLAEGNAEATALIRKQEGDAVSELIEVSGAKEINLLRMQKFQQLKDQREHQAKMYLLAKTDSAVAVEIEENEIARQVLKQKYADRLIDFAEYQNNMDALIKKGNSLKAQPTSFDTDHFVNIAQSAKESINQTLTNFVDSGIAAAMATSFSAMGTALVEGGNILQAAGEGMKAAFGDLMKALGQQFITMGAVKMAAGVLASPFGWKMVGEGASLMALGAGLSIGGGVVGSIGSGSKNKGSNTTAQPSYGVPGFATGVNNFSGGLALVGERGPELVNLPSGSDVIPNHKVFQANNNSDKTQVMISSLEIKGQDLYVMFKKAEKTNKRI